MPAAAMLEQIQPSRWSPTAWSSGTLLKKDHPRLAGGFSGVGDDSTGPVLALLERVVAEAHRADVRELALVSLHLFFWCLKQIRFSSGV